MIKLTDTHTHYDDEAFDSDRDQLLTRLFSQSVKRIVTVGCAQSRWKATLELTEKYEGMFGAAGLHPEDIYDISEDWEQVLREYLCKPKIVALGEIGLDYHCENYSREDQLKFFRRQLEIAKEMSMPVIVHSRDATLDTLETMKELKPDNAVIHCFSGSAETAKEYVNMGCYISFTGVITFKNAKKALEACQAVPIERLMLETDCPYMSPVPLRGKRCDSSMIIYTAAKMAEIKRVSTEEMIGICNDNSQRFFHFAE